LRLFPHNDRPGLWVNRDWVPGTPGTFAVVIGISDYTALDGGLESLALGKLPVCALSAFRFFEWLEAEYYVEGCPLAMCWLLLAPTDEELKLGPRMANQALSPDFFACDNAVQAWFAEMKQLPEPAAKESRSIFFFSGHGLEVIEDRQILLPRDYQPSRNVERALSSQNIARGVKRLKVPLHFLFLDACRKDHDKLSDFAPITGTAILNEPTNKTINAICKVPLVYASAAGHTSWSPKVTAGTRSVFSQALIEGLEAQGLKPDCGRQKCWIHLSKLYEFMQSRMQEILKTQYSSSETQEPIWRGDQAPKPITELSRPQPEDWLPPVPPEPPLDVGGPPPPGSTDAIGFVVRGDSSGGINLEQIKTQLADAGVYSFSSQTWLPGGSVEITNLRRKEESNHYEFDFRIRNAAKGQLYWFESSTNRHTIACVLPTDSLEQTTFHATLHASPEAVNSTALKVTLSENNHGFLREAHKLWQKSERGVLTVADLQMSFLKSLYSAPRSGIERFSKSSLAALIMASILGRTAHWNLFGDWVRALANPRMTDGAVLWSERLLQRGEGPAIEPLKYFMLLDTAPLPLLSYTLSLALRQAEYFDSIKTLPASFREAIERIHQRLVHAIGTFRPGGLVSCFTGRQDQVSVDNSAAPNVADQFRVALSRAVLQSPRKPELMQETQSADELTITADKAIAFGILKSECLELEESDRARARMEQREFSAETDS
jgi:Caspase domain